MTKWLVTMTFMVLSAILMVPWGAPLQASPQGARGAAGEADGRALYLTHCASCHGTTGRGDGPAAGSLRRSPSDLTLFARQNGGVFPSAKMQRIVDGREVGAHGSAEMPVWGDTFKHMNGHDAAVVTARIAAIVRFLESIQARTGH